MRRMEQRRLPDRKGEPNQVASKTGTVSVTIGGKVKKFVSKYEEKIKFKQENIPSYFSMF